MALDLFRDISNWQGPGYAPVGDEIIKATEGTDYVDPDWTVNVDRATANGRSYLLYHFLRSGNIAAQVAHGIATIGRGRNIMLDVEVAGDGTYPTWPETLEFIDLYAAQSGGGRVILAYIPQWFWSSRWNSPSLLELVARGCGLISSVYTTYSDTGPGWQPYGGVTPIIWQYTATPIDTNAFKGTPAQLEQLFAGGLATTAAPAAPATVEGELMRVVFDPSYTDRPAELVDPHGQPVVVATDGVGAYFVLDVSYQLAAVETQALGLPVETLTRGGNMPAGWDFPTAFAQVTGGCVFAGQNGLAAWRQAAAAPPASSLGASDIAAIVTAVEAGIAAKLGA